MELSLLLALAIAAFGLGACPFSVWIGRWLLKKDVRDYGDANPGAWNVFRAGGRKAGWLALVLDVGKGVPVVMLAGSFFNLPAPAVLAIGISAILGHSFSPFLRFRGGKAVAVTYGVLVALPQREIFLFMAIFMLLGFLFIENRAWVIMLGPLGTLACFGIMGKAGIEILFVLSVLLIFAIKNYPDLKAVPGHRGIILQWLQSIRQ
jgi:acyl phosphate:glycerol-3-phosphate acyltransferase